MTDKNMRPLLTGLLCGAAFIALASCGGGGSGGGGGGAGVAGTATAAPSEPGQTASATSNPSAAAQVAAASPVVGDCPMFPANAIFNTRIDDPARFPALPQSSDWINRVGRGTPFTTDWGKSLDPADRNAYFGIPINVVDGTAATTSWPVTHFDFTPSGQSTESGFTAKSDCAVDDGHGGFNIVRGCASIPEAQRHFPFPSSNVLNQGGTCNDPRSCGDHHVLVVEKGACRLWESYFSYNLSGQWYSLAVAAWDLNSLAMRPNDWNSADAAGLPITPLLAKASEASAGEIKHALQVTFAADKLTREFLWPARFAAGGTNPGAIPFGALLRLKSDFVIPEGWSPQSKALATAAKRYGMYVGDIGVDFFVGGEPSTGWDMQTIHDQMSNIKMSDMEFVDLKAVTGDSRFSADSMAASW